MPKLVDHDAQRRAIASAAIDVIDEAGLENARLRDVAERAGVTTGAVTHYFDGKDAVLLAALEEIMRRILETQNALPESENIAAIAAAFLPLDAQSRREWRVWVAFCGRAAADPAMRRRHARYYEGIGARICAHLIRAQPGLRRSEARLQADVIVAAIDGVGLRATLEPEDWPAERQCETLRALLQPLLAATEIV